eukprot:m.82902 g.82902  ORF g.82902 m.82902 type:complete len:380 (-) comp14943_c0_seq1:206-1345(-)
MMSTATCYIITRLNHRSIRILSPSLKLLLFLIILPSLIVAHRILIICASSGGIYGDCLGAIWAFAKQGAEALPRGGQRAQPLQNAVAVERAPALWLVADLVRDGVAKLVGEADAALAVQRLQGSAGRSWEGHAKQHFHVSEHIHALLPLARATEVALAQRAHGVLWPEKAALGQHVRPRRVKHHLHRYVIRDDNPPNRHVHGQVAWLQHPGPRVDAGQNIPQLLALGDGALELLVDHSETASARRPLQLERHRQPRRALGRHHGMPIRHLDAEDVAAAVCVGVLELQHRHAWVQALQVHPADVLDLLHQRRAERGGRGGGARPRELDFLDKGAQLAQKDQQRRALLHAVSHNLVVPLEELLQAPVAVQPCSCNRRGRGR